MGQDARTNDELESKLKHYRLNRDEHRRIAGLLGREPQGVEWALFSAMWSEHCSYKSSRVHLKGIFNKSPRVLQSFGENAGVVDLGDGERVAFKIESHNHPSFIEPYQGAATGVGGILRDIFTMGARPIAIADYLCFGRPQAERMEKIVDGVVKGIGGYGNPVGVPTITGQTEFDPSYDKNVLVNAMAVGLFRPGEKVFLSKAKGVGNLVVYAGAKTGRDGVHGASMASESFGQDSEKKRPTIQIGDPFFEKLLIEACLEVMEQDLVVAIQDMGAAGLTSSSFEMASKGGVGFNLHLDRVPLRDSSLIAEDILLSESQERMLLVVEPSKLGKVEALFRRWGLDAVAIGEVTADKRMKLYWKGDLLTDIDPELLTEHAPMYERPYEAWSPKNRVADVSEVSIAKDQDQSMKDILLASLSSPQGTSREFIYRQYDGHVGASTAADCHESVGVVRLKDSGRGLGVVLGCRPQMMRLDANEGGADAVAYPALELAAKGFEALAVTDCLNFGNPERVPVMSSFVASLKGMNDVCRALETPIISGNVSFYNETEGRNITPTPSTGVVGLRPSVDKLPKSHFHSVGESVYLLRWPLFTSTGVLGENAAEVRAIGSVTSAEALSQLKSACSTLRHLTQGSDGLVSASRVVGKFGLAYALAKMTLQNQIGIKVSEEALTLLRWNQNDRRSLSNLLFCENNYEVILVSKEDPSAFAARVKSLGGPVVVNLGMTDGDQLQFGKELSLSLKILKDTYENGWVKAFKSLPAKG
jgi:phosphoribosylformylglycinamidine synthase II